MHELKNIFLSKIVILRVNVIRKQHIAFSATAIKVHAKSKSTRNSTTKNVPVMISAISTTRTGLKSMPNKINEISTR